MFLTAALSVAQTVSAAQPLSSSPPLSLDRIVRPMIAVDQTTLQSEGLKVHLWGIKAAETSETTIEIRALDLLDKLINNEMVNCKFMSETMPEVTARCAVSTNADLGMELLNHGYAVVDRHQTYNSVLASAYAGAQETARVNQRGIWKFVKDEDKKSILPQWLESLLPILVPVGLILGPFGGLLIVAFVMRYWLSRIESLQQSEIDHSHHKEALMQSRERHVLLSTLEGELSENKNKIQAFLTIYGDMLRSLQNPNEIPKYQQMGDTVQKHPSLSKTIFEANIGKLSLLEMKLAGMLSKFYTALPAKQEYINLDSNVPLETAVKLVEKILKEAEEVLQPINHLLEEITGAGQR